MPEDHKHISRSISEILTVMETQPFEDWYSTRFIDYITGEKDIKKEEITEELYQLLK